MMPLDDLDVLDIWPLPNLDEFVRRCLEKKVSEINVTGSNTDPLLYQHTAKLRHYLEERIPNLVLGIRTNGVLALRHPEILKLYDKGSLTICSLNPEVYRKMMGQGSPPNVAEIQRLTYTYGWTDPGLKVNVVLGPENLKDQDWYFTVLQLSELGFKRINLREPYGQPHLGDPLAKLNYSPIKLTLGMPTYQVGHAEVTYWDVHYVEAESVNLYANGIVSETYPITKGHHPTGRVLDQDHFPGGRVQDQWIQLKRKGKNS